MFRDIHSAHAARQRGVDIGAGGNQQSRRIRLVAVRGRDQRGASAIIARRDAGALREQALHLARIAAFGSGDELRIDGPAVLGYRGTAG